jgi:endonuclease YncB( thermonuclease family)
MPFSTPGNSTESKPGAELIERIPVNDVRHRVFVRAAAALLVLALLVHAVTAVEITGRVVGIADGDTLTILDADHRQTKVRLAEIDAPESHQPYGTRAKQVLSELVFGRDRADIR